jgi:quinolinate synthase
MNAAERQQERAETLKRIEAAKDALGKNLIILAHFYQEDDIVQYADFVGDSLQLARAASMQKDARYIVFCAVSFMAEMARIICSPEQEVLHPEPDARCPLADMAAIEKVEAAWEGLKAAGRRIIPVVYVNSNADLKAFCGRHGGLVCTSSNAEKVFSYVFSQGASLFFFPDENLGRNTARRLGIRDSEIIIRDPSARSDETDKGRIEEARIFLWKGYCYVHTDFLPSDIVRIKDQYEGIRIVVHPECTPEVVSLSDYAGSTAFIKDIVERSGPGTKWAIGTEWNFVKRIKNENPDKLVVPLRESGCSEMSKVTPRRLLAVLEGLLDNRYFGRVEVEAGIAKDAKMALKRMLEVS